MQFEQAGEFIINKLKNELPGGLLYHCLDHIVDVYAAAEHLGRKEGLNSYEIKLLLTAAWYHDSGFIKGAKDHEEESCTIARTALPLYGYSAEEIKRICGMIIATKIPQSPHNHLEEILSDADLDYLGRDDFYTTGDKLYRELVASGVIVTGEEWDRLQVNFLESHHYFTKTAIASREEKKDAHLAELKRKLQLATGF